MLGVITAGVLGMGAQGALANSLNWSYTQVATGSCNASKGCDPSHPAVYERRVIDSGDRPTQATTSIRPRGLAEASASSDGELMEFPELKSRVEGRPAFDGAYSWNYAFTEGVIGYRWEDPTRVVPLSTFGGMLSFSNLGGFAGYAIASLALLYDDVESLDVARLWRRDNGVGGFAANCSTPGAGGIATTGQVFTQGGQVTSYAAEQCDGTFTLTEGKTYYLWARLDTFIAGYGAVDASHTFTIDFGPDVSEDLRQTIVMHSIPVTEGLQMPGVPEPSTWALLIAGFAGAGAVLRRRLNPGDHLRRVPQR